MKASECLKRPKDAARNSEGEIIFAYRNHYTEGLRVQRLCGDCCVTTYTKPDNVPGDDWQPLLPAVDLSELPTFERSPFCSRDTWVKLSDLESIVPVKPCDCEKKLNAEKKSSAHWQKQFEAERAKVRELEEKLETCRKYISSVDEVVSEKNKKLRDMQAELYTLREQSKWELGEPLTEEVSNSNYIAVASPNNPLWPAGTMMYGFWHGTREHDLTGNDYWAYYLDPRPLPAIPETEPEEPKTLWAVRSFDELLGWHTRWYDNETDADDYMDTLDVDDQATKQAYTIEPMEPPH